MFNLLRQLPVALKQRAWLRYALILAFFAAAALLLARPALNAAFFGDDLHLVRVYSADELRSVWSGAWDTDGIETAGYRPLTTIFNHLRASLFGESVMWHRLFLLLLFALYLILAVLLARQVTQASYGIGLLGGMLALTHVSSTYHYLWVSDGVHLVGGVLILASVLLMLHALRTGQARWLIGSTMSVFLSLLVREDNLIALPLLALFAAVYGWEHPIELRRLRGSLIVYGAALLVGTASFWWLRGQFVPGAVALKVEVGNYLWTIKQVVQNPGDLTNLLVWWPDYARLIGLWLIAVGFLIAVWLFVLPTAARRAAAIWFAALLLSALPGLTLPRTNLLLLAATFWGLCVATVLREFARRSRWAAIAATLIALLAILGPAWGSTTLQIESDPASLDWLCGHPAWVYGEYSNATVPETRRAAIKETLAHFGISSMADLSTRYPQLVDEAASAGRFGPDSTGQPFLPHFSFVTYPGWQDWSCLTRNGWQFRRPQ
jgi:hypothetical protein